MVADARRMVEEMRGVLQYLLAETEGWRDGAEGLLLALGAATQRYFAWAYLAFWPSKRA